jgi:transposase
MLKKIGAKQTKMVFLTIEDLMPEEHFLRDVDKYVNFDFIYDRVEHLYSKIGKPSIDPVVIIKMLLIGYLYDIISERRIEKEIHVNIAYRWFLKYDLDETIPDHSTISQLRRRKFKDTELFREIFDEVVRRCMEAGLVNGELLLTDSTHVKADVCDIKREVVIVKEEPSAYMKRLDELALQDGLITETKKTSPKAKEKTKEIKKSITDPDSGILKRPGKPGGFHYLSHNTIDGNNGIITDVHVTAGNEKDSTPHSERIQYQIEKFGFNTKEVGGDTGYDCGEIHSDMLEMGIKTYIPKCEHANKYTNLTFNAEDFKFDIENDCYICPNGCVLKYSGYVKGEGQKRYAAHTKDCSNCPLKSRCIAGKVKKYRTINRPYHQTQIEIQQQNNDTPRYAQVLRKRQIRCEGNNSHQKARHCLTRAKMRGIEKVTEQCLLSACALNLKRLVKKLKSQGRVSATACFTELFYDIFGFWGKRQWSFA